MELYEFLQFLVTLAFSRDAGGGPGELADMVKGLKRSVKIAEMKPILAELQADAEISSSLGRYGVEGLYGEVKKQAITERVLMQFLESKKMIRSVIVTMPGGAEGKSTLTWQDASAAFQLAGNGGSALNEKAFSDALCLCGVVKYATVQSFSDAQRVEGFFDNLTGKKDEHAVIGAGA